MNNNSSPLIKWAFVGFGITVGIINALLTAVFSYTYLPAAFGQASGVFAQYAAAAYGLLIMDVAYVAWFYVYLRLAESKGQRDLAIAVSIVALLTSIMATVTQLVTNSFGLVDLSAYQETVGVVSLTLMIVVTALHIVAFASYTLLDPRERVKTEAAKIKAAVLENSLNQMRSRVDNDTDAVVDAFAGRIRKDVLRQLGFTPDLRFIGNEKDNGGDPPALPAPEPNQEVVTEFEEDNPPPLPDDAPPGARWERVTIGGTPQWVLAFPPAVSADADDSAPAPIPNGQTGD